MEDSEQLELEQIRVLNVALRMAGVSVDMPSTAVIKAIVNLVEVKKDEVNIKEVNTAITTVFKNPLLNPPKPQEAPATAKPVPAMAPVK